MISTENNLSAKTDDSSWQSLMRHSVCRPEELAELTADEVAELQAVIQVYPMRINSYFLELIRKSGASIARQVVPDPRELEDELGLEDPLAEEANSPVANITHRYPDRVLFTVCHECAIYCRFCTRKRKTGKWPAISQSDLELGIDYIRRTPAVRDVLLSGGDPLLLSDHRLDWLLFQLREINHVDIIRIGSRVPCALPQRITDDLIHVLRKGAPLYLNLHFNHPDEITDEVKQACSKLADAGLVLGSQTVLLRGINDSPEVIKALMRALLKIRVKPYYLMQGDLTRGTDHFRTPIQQGINILKALRGRVSGMAIPTLVLDLPGGGGKVPLCPDYIFSRDEAGTVLFNYQGREIRYPEPKGNL